MAVVSPKPAGYAPGVSRKHFLQHFLYTLSEPRDHELSLYERRLNAPDKSGCIRLARRTGGITLEDRRCEILAAWKGWRPSAVQGLETGSGSSPRGRILAGHRIDRPVFFPAPRSPASCPGMLCGRRGSPDSVQWAPRPAGRAEMAPARLTRTRIAIEKRPALHLLKRSEEPGVKTRRNDEQRGYNGGARNFTSYLSFLQNA